MVSADARDHTTPHRHNTARHDTTPERCGTGHEPHGPLPQHLIFLPFLQPRKNGVQSMLPETISLQFAPGKTVGPNPDEGIFSGLRTEWVDITSTPSPTRTLSQVFVLPPTFAGYHPALQLDVLIKATCLPAVVLFSGS